MGNHHSTPARIEWIEDTIRLQYQKPAGTTVLPKQIAVRMYRRNEAIRVPCAAERRLWSPSALPLIEKRCLSVFQRLAGCKSGAALRKEDFSRRAWERRKYAAMQPCYCMVKQRNIPSVSRMTRKTHCPLIVSYSVSCKQGGTYHDITQ